MDVVRWWTTFGDPMLEALVERAARANQDLRIAAARVREARALRARAVGDFFPIVDADGSYTNARRSENALNFPVDQLQTGLWETGFDAAWEIDVFGGKRRALEAATADLAAAVEDLRDVLVTVLAEVARNYVEVRSLQQRLDIARRNIGAQQEALEITEARVRAGLTSELDVTQAAAILETTRAQVPALETALHAAIHRLGVLLGEGPGALLGELAAAAPVPAPPPRVPIGLPADLLRRRPDVRESERRLAAATARIGVETAELFPKLSLTGVAGLQSLSASDLFTGASRYWSAGPTVRWRLFDGGRIRAQIRAEDARQEAALAAYEKTVLRALEEVENALVAYAKEQARYEALADAVAANRRALELSSALYTTGIGEFLSVLDAERSLHRTEDELAASQGTVSLNLVALYKALGGGWQEGMAGVDTGA
jgi:NodT family efflux transporter outer membrane factor (OMF) lipoprotein